MRKAGSDKGVGGSTFKVARGVIGIIANNSKALSEKIQKGEIDFVNLRNKED